MTDNKETTTPFPRLNLPQCKLQLQQGDDGQVRVYDALRKGWYVLTPEEWVRQHFVNMLVQGMNYSPLAMANEVGIRLNGTLKRCDTVVYDNTGRVAMIIEYKQPTIPITRKVLDQVARYNLTLGARFLVVSNGMSTFCCKLGEKGGYQFMTQLPPYGIVKV